MVVEAQRGVHGLIIPFISFGFKIFSKKKIICGSSTVGSQFYESTSLYSSIHTYDGKILG